MIEIELLSICFKVRRLTAELSGSAILFNLRADLLLFYLLIMNSSPE